MLAGISLPAAAQTSVTGRIMEGPLAIRPTACSTGDVFMRTDSPYTMYSCGPNSTWNVLGGFVTGTYITATDETGTLTNSRVFVDGSNTTVNISTLGQIAIDAEPPSGGTWDENHTYNDGDFVSVGNDIYVSLSDLNQGYSPLLYPAKWRVLAPGDYFDPRNYGATTTNPNIFPVTNCSIASGLTAMTVTDGGNYYTLFQNGDGITCSGAGASHSLSTPSAPTVTPSLTSQATGSGLVVNAPAVGATSYSYKIVAMTIDNGYTASSSAGTTAAGYATLGPQGPVNITSIARSELTNTVTCAATCNLSVGAQVHINETLDPDHAATFSSFDGWYEVATAPDSTHFTYLQNQDTRAGAAATATGGNVSWYASNHLTWSAVTNAWKYAIYGRTAGTWNFIGFSRPSTSSITENYFDDFGSTMMSDDGTLRPEFLPAAAPSAATANSLVTKIVSGGGTHNLVVANAASNTTTTGSAVFDSSLGILAAAQAAIAAHGVLYFPIADGNAFVVGSHLILPAGTVLRMGGRWLQVYDTLEAVSSLNVFGDLDSGGNGAATFALSNGVTFRCKAWPCIFLNQVSTTNIQGLNITWLGNNNALLLLADGTSYTTISNSVFTTSTTNADRMGMSLVFRSPGDAFENHFNRNTFLGGPDQSSYNLTSTPQIMTVGDVGNMDFTYNSFNRRGIFWRSGQPVANFLWSHIQGPITPYFSAANCGGNLKFENVIVDSGFGTIFANTCGNTWSIVNYNGSSASGGAGPEISGPLIAQLEATGAHGTFQNRDTSTCYAATALLPTYGTNTFINLTGASTILGCAQRAPFDFPAQHQATWSYGFRPSSVAGSVAAGGSTPVGSFIYQVTAIGFDGGESLPSDASGTITTTSGNQTVNLTWTGIAGASVYNVYRAPVGTTSYSTVKINATTNSFSDIGASQESRGYPNFPGTGSVVINGISPVFPSITLYGGLSGGVSFKGVITPPTLTANRVWTLPNATGSVVVWGGSTPSNADCAQFAVSAGIVTLQTSGGSCGGGGGGSGTVTSIATTSPISGGTITTTGTISCPTCGVTGTGLNQFASTTSSQLAGVISDETGSGALVFAVSATFTGTTAISEAITFAGDITPTQITSNQNDYNPTGLSTASTIRLSSDASRNITGLQGGSDGRLLFLQNVGGANVVLVDESASSTAANRFALDGNQTIVPDQLVILQYDSTASRWRSGYFTPTVVSVFGRTGTVVAATNDYNFNQLAGSLACSQMPALTGDTTSSAGSCANINAKVNGVAYPATPSTHQVPVVTASNTVTYKTVTNCTDTGGQHLNYTQSTDLFSCGTSGDGGGVSASGTPTSGQAAEWTNATTIQGVATAGGGATYLKCTITSAAAGDYFAYNATPICVNQTPGIVPNSQTGTSYTWLTGDRGKVVWQSNASATAYTLPQAGGTGFANNWYGALFNVGAGLVTITPTTSTINGASTQIVPQYWYGPVYSDNTNYRMPVMPTISAFPNCTDTVGQHLNFTTSTGAFSCGTSVPAAPSFATSVTAPLYKTTTNCADSAGAAACGAAPAGAFVVDAASTSTVVSTTAVTSTSRIFLQEDVSLGTELSVTCNTQALSVFNPRVTARTAGTSFTVTIDAGPTTNPLCMAYHLVN